jgi:hypothetical protein
VKKAVRWTRLGFGKHAGMSLPELLVTDPNYFFWLIGGLKGKLAKEAKVLKWRATHIRIPKKGGKKQAVGYFRDSQALAYVDLVPRAYLKKPPRPVPGRSAEFGKFLDLSVASRYDGYDKGGPRELLGMLRELFFEKHHWIRSRDAERFFGDESNFAVKKLRKKKILRDAK